MDLTPYEGESWLHKPGKDMTEDELIRAAVAHDEAGEHRHAEIYMNIRIRRFIDPTWDPDGIYSTEEPPAC
ncbi:hypothetical protein ACIRYZ_38885 [Kitasatospora sp. NPDC101155]|uniref:hypothetical protein n=1 Tax=Kitasatospora sp. NPDC101155 TaxID=3364097 RepID=UPI0037FFDA9E